ncbi:MAG: hypothetical protein C0601_08265 [Candidatus Muiribacterium halophilum]|uniref:Response regulatory domain-containing protein n=1 Tax=Muiribacterium halophilum TaxID=2053465 RepID=A0A2N5ZEK7_MUIH1|nr:MAG: hypothetical protein C0601_08265 [Candidatus Muirbacterium halophilum]
MMMPVYDGFYFLEQYEKEFEKKYIPVIVMSAAGDTRSISKAFDYGIYDYFTKPLSSVQLMSFELKVKNALRMKNTMDQLRERNRIIENEMNLAAKLQRKFLPNEISNENFELKYYYRPYRELSGDYLDVIPLAGDKVLILIADVVGHGTASAMIGSMLKMHAIDFVESHPDFDLVDFVKNSNAELIRLGVEDTIVTACFFIYETKTGFLNYVVAGHPYPLVFDFDQDDVFSLENPGTLPLGLFDNIDVMPGEIRLKAGQTLAVYTDGILEAKDYDGEFFGLENIESTSKDFVEANDVFEYNRFITSLIGKLDSIQDDVTIVFFSIRK